MSPHDAGGGAAILGDMPQRVSAAVMVGREAPMGALRDAYAAAREHDGQVAVIGGEAGAGKTRLVTEFLEQTPSATQLAWMLASAMRALVM